jgi:hypothetical protein
VGSNPVGVVVVVVVVVAAAAAAAVASSNVLPTYKAAHRKKVSIALLQQLLFPKVWQI